MSLINDALKKAQKQRTGESPPLASMPGLGGETPQRIARRAKPAGFNTLLVRAGVGGVVLILALGGWLVLRQKTATAKLKPEVVQTTQPSSPKGGSPLAGGPSPASAPTQVSGFSSQVSVPPPAAPVPTFTLPVAPKPEPVVAKVEAPATVAGVADPGLPAVALAKAGPASPRPATSIQPTGSNPQVSPFSTGGRPGQTPDSQQGTTAPPASPSAKLEPRAITYIEAIKVAGIMSRSTDAKVLMNDRVYRLGSIVEAELGLKLVGITPNSLTFEDDHGARYTRTF